VQFPKYYFFQLNNKIHIEYYENSPINKKKPKQTTQNNNNNNNNNNNKKQMLMSSLKNMFK